MTTAAALIASAGASFAGGHAVGACLITKTDTNPFFVKMKEGALAKAEELGVNLSTFAGKIDGDHETQVAAIETCITNGAKGILLTASDTSSIVPAVQQAREAGLFVIALDTPLNPIDAADMTFATDNFLAGELIGKWAAPGWRGRTMDLSSYRRVDHCSCCRGSMDQKGSSVMEPILKARGLVKRFGRVVALDHCDFDLMPGEILGVIGDNGAGKSTLIKAISGALSADDGEIWLEGQKVSFTSPIAARDAGIETVYQTLAMSPALLIADNMFMGREIRKQGWQGKWLRRLDRRAMETFARQKLSELGLLTIQNINQAVETLSGGQRQGVAVARAAAFGSKVIILDEPTAALGVKESRKVLNLIQDVKAKGVPIILISHNMPHVFEVCDRIHIHRLGKRLTVIDPKDYEMSDAVAFMTGAKDPT